MTPPDRNRTRCGCPSLGRPDTPRKDTGAARPALELARPPNPRESADLLNRRLRPHDWTPVTQTPAHSSPPSRAQSLSVVIPARNAERTLQACVRAVLANSVAPDAVIVVDDGSSDRTADLVRAFAESSPVQLVQRAVSGGAATARNDGARTVTSDIILFLDADTEAKPDLIEMVLERFASSGADAVCGVYDPVPLNPGLAPAYKAMFDSYQFSKRGVTQYDGFSGSCGAVRTSAFREVGGG